MKKAIFFSIIGIFSLTNIAFAHHLWVEKEGDKFRIAWGHPPKIDPYDPERIKGITAFDKKGETVAFERIDEKDQVYLSTKADISMIILSFEGGYLVSTPDGKKRLTKREAQKAGFQVIDSFYSLQLAKSLFSYTDVLTKPVGMKFEIVPMKNPLLLKTNELLPVKVLFDGKPMEGVAIDIGAHKGVGKTSKEGIANIKITGQGMQVILAKYRIATKYNSDADYLSYTTVLTFEVK